MAEECVRFECGMMLFDIFFSISQTPDTSGYIPSEKEMFSNFFEQVDLADELGFGVGWVAQAHLSTEIQKRNNTPVVPHYPGEVGLCTDFFQIAQKMFSRTKKMEVGSAVLSILASGGPIAIAERVGAFLALHGMDGMEDRKLHIGFSAGRFEFMARPYGIIPRNIVEEAAWPALRGQIFAEASEIFLRLLNGEVISSNMIRDTVLTRENFRSDEDWKKVQDAAKEFFDLKELTETVEIPNRYDFEEIKTIPQNWRRDLLNLVLGSHDPNLQIEVNKWRPVQVFNLSITPPHIIEETHERMAENYHLDGGKWNRGMMPRTIMVFVNNEEGLSSEEQSIAAKEEAKAALNTYWSALEGTIDPSKVERATDNAVIGNVEEVAEQIIQRFDRNDKLMCWFDFFNHDSERVQRNMKAFMDEVAPIVNGEE
ncbi:MAG: LLM class flavin-dependent oxidoreductase [Candidatus Poseidoniales archaeon]|uniref:Bacterial luciferase domain-containing protein n=1 Tax=uncultured Poseidoniia archaeon TaxID=1697135 RepID=A0A1B1TEA4_9ARCH|nr:bacterial luciferase domain-containing protein [uncultured Candidatus Thalassoarchaea sp.]MAV19763.1 luciferase [Euryarchaeota archaeon]MDA7603098.1 LLM class flavin-dependent oxidoreductase [Euryarchaeota archaeon]RCH75710.1 MAG: LLM class flavin-dependent oxidoreductase [Candidatus Poseidoniales archaeon]